MPASKDFDEWDLRDVVARGDTHAASIPGDAALVIDRLWLPDRERAEKDLAEAGIQGTAAAEFLRERVIRALDSIKQRGSEWNDAQGSTAAPRVSAETQAGSSPRDLSVMKNPMTIAELAAARGCSRQAACKLARRLARTGHARKSHDGTWLVDREAARLIPIPEKREAAA